MGTGGLKLVVELEAILLEREYVESMLMEIAVELVARTRERAAMQMTPHRRQGRHDAEVGKIVIKHRMQIFADGKDGNGVHLDAASFEYVDYKDDEGKSCSDHRGAKVVFNYTTDDSFRPESADDFTVEKFNLFKEIKRVLTTFFDTLFLCLRNLALLKVQKPFES